MRILLAAALMGAMSLNAQTVTPYTEVSRVSISVATLSTNWQNGIRTVSQEFAAPYKHGGAGPQPAQLPDNLVEQLAQLERTDALRFNDLQQQIQQAHTDAIAYMKLTPNQITADTALFNQATTQAQTSTPIAGLVANRPDPQRFAAMATYLGNLLKQLGDYQ